MSLTIDASVWVALGDATEPEYTSCAQLFRHIRSSAPELMTPTLLLVEVAAAAARKSRDESVGLELARQVRALPFQRWLPLDEAMAGAAQRLGARLFLRGADAVYAAVAAATGSTLITLDLELASRAGAALPVISPAAWLSSIGG